MELVLPDITETVLAPEFVTNILYLKESYAMQLGKFPTWMAAIINPSYTNFIG